VPFELLWFGVGVSLAAVLFGLLSHVLLLFLSALLGVATGALVGWILGVTEAGAVRNELTRNGVSLGRARRAPFLVGLLLAPLIAVSAYSIGWMINFLPLDATAGAFGSYAIMHAGIGSSIRCLSLALALRAIERETGKVVWIRIDRGGYTYTVGDRPAHGR